MNTLAAPRLRFAAAHPALQSVLLHGAIEAAMRAVHENVHSDAIRAQGCRTTAAYFDPRERSELNRHGCSERACLR
jgi:hypothetical protein